MNTNQITTNGNASITSGQFIDALSAHREWSSRPPDERYQSVEALHTVALAQLEQSRTAVERVAGMKMSATDAGELILVGREAYANLTHWSFGQIAAAAKAPASYLRTLPAPLAADCLNVGLNRIDAREHHRLYLGETGDGYTLRALTSDRYERVYNARITAQILTLMQQRPAWQLPLGYKNGVWGAERVPSGAYLSDRDMFLMLIDGNREIDDPADGTHSGMFRGFIIRNSEVGAAKLTIDLFLFRRVCGNNIIWGFEHVAGFSRRHVGRGVHKWDEQLRIAARALNADTSEDNARIARAIRTEIGASKREVLKLTEPIVGKPLALAAYDLAERHESDPRSVWGFSQGLTRATQATSYQDDRFDGDRAVRDLFEKFIR